MTLFVLSVLLNISWLGLIMSAAVSSVGFKGFVRDAAFDGFSCALNDTVLASMDMTTFACARACQRHPECRSMFILSFSSGCLGCLRRYKPVDMLGVVAGSQYFGYYETKTQWAINVTGFSSEYSPNGWSAKQVLGPPNVYPNYGDIGRAWAPLDKNAYQFIQIQFAKAVYITGVEVYETLNAGGVKAIKALDGWGNWTTLWSTSTVQVIKSARVFAPNLSVTMSIPSRDVRIEIDCTASNSWVEIDAVKLLGIK